MSILFSKKLINDDISGHYSFENFEKGFRVVTKNGEKFAFLSISKGVFEEDYKRYWKSIIVICKKDRILDKAIFFTEDEILQIKQLIILHWMYFYAVNNMRIDIKQSDLDHSQSRDIVRYKSQEKYGKGSEEADIVASNTIGIDVKKYTDWRKSREYFESQK